MRMTALTVVLFVLLAGCAGGSLETTDAEVRAVEPRAKPSADRDLDEALSPGLGNSKPQRRQQVERNERTERTPEPKQQPVRRPAVQRHQVLDVIDGDTVKVLYRGSEVSVRVIGIDTPETVHPSEPVECGGPEASATAARMLTGKRVRLVFDPSQGRIDAYGRTLAYLQTPGIGDFGLAMIRQGRAVEYTYDSSYARQARYLPAQRNAQAAGRGIWNRCGGVDKPLTQPEPAPAPAPKSRPRGGPSGNCDPGYDPCVPPYPPDLDCADVDGPIRITGDDPHGFDADGDGIGCDS
jgi:endonuclease YncB( thermonuclease family)